MRGQYAPGSIDGQPVPGYRQEPGVAADSGRETLRRAAKLQIDNWRWAGVPFYLRDGQAPAQARHRDRHPLQDAPASPSSARAGVLVQEPNVLVLRIQPDEGIALRIGAKQPGPTMRDRAGEDGLPLRASTSARRPPTPTSGSSSTRCTATPRSSRAATRWRRRGSSSRPSSTSGARTPPSDLPNYEAGTWGPEAAMELLARDGRRWRRP